MRKLFALFAICFLLFGNTAQAAYYDENSVIGAGTLMNPTGLAKDSAGNIYVCDRGNTRIAVFNSSGSFVRDFANGVACTGIAVDSSNNRVYVADYASGSVVYYSLTGSYFGEFVSVVGPYGLAVDSNSNLWVTNESASPVKMISWDKSVTRVIGSIGSGSGQFNLPGGIVVSGDSVIVADSGNSRLVVTNRTGSAFSTIGSFGTGDRQFNYPDSLAFLPNGKLVVTDSGNGRFQILNKNLTFYDKTAGLSAPTGLIVDVTGDIYVSENINQIKKFKVKPAQAFVSNVQIAVAEKQISLSWTVSGTLDAVKVERSLTAEGNRTKIYEGKSVTYKDTGLSDVTRYYYFVSAKGPNGMYGPEVMVTGQTPAPQPQAFLTNLKGVATERKVSLSWTATGIPVSFRILRGKDFCPNTVTPDSSKITIYEGSAYSFNDLGVTDDTNYCYAGYAKGVNGIWSSGTIAWAKTPIALPQALPVPGYTSGIGSINLAWNVTGTNTETKVYRSLTSDGEKVLLYRGQDLTFNDVGLYDNATYYYSFVSKGPNGVYSNPVTLVAKTWGESHISLGSPQTIEYGYYKYLSGTLVDITGSPLAEMEISLQQKKGTEWVEIRKTNTDSDGYFSFWVNPGSNANYKVVFSGKPTLDKLYGYKASFSSVVLVRVKMILTATLAKASLPKGTYQRIYGKLSPKHPNATMYLQKYNYTTKKWTWYKTLKTDANSYYSTRFVVKTKGSWAMRVFVPSHWDHVSPTPPKLYFKVK